MNRLIDFCIRERLLIGLLSIGIVVYGIFAMRRVPVDAIPNVGENQVIVLTEWSGRSPKDVEDQITYPLSIALQSVPGADSVRGKSMFGFSFVQVTFADDVDPYWARSRVNEQLTTIGNSLPSEATPVLAPDATALGQIYYYVLDAPADMDLAELRSKQDYFIKFALQSVEGVAEVASIGGYVKQYQIEVDPNKLRYHELPLSSVISAVKDANNEVGAKTVEQNGMEFILRGRGYIGSGKTELATLEQIEDTVVAAQDGIPITVGQLARVQVGPANRRGALDFNGREAVGGVVVMQNEANPREVIQRLKEKIELLQGQLDGVKIVGVYDRTKLIDETVSTLTTALSEEIIVTIVVMLLFLLHVRASLVIAITLPLGVLMSFIAMHLFGVDANIMSLAGIAIAIGTMVDMGIIVLENVYDGLARWEAGRKQVGSVSEEAENRLRVIRDSALEVIPAVITAVATTIVSFLPVFMLTGRDQRLFSPLAWTKTFALASSLIVAVVIVPALCRVFLRTSATRIWKRVITALGCSLLAALMVAVWREAAVDAVGLSDAGLFAVAAIVGLGGGWWMSGERIRPVEENPISRFVRWLYGGRLRFALKHKSLALSLPVILFVIGLGAWFGLPTILRPLEQLAHRVGAELNDVPGYVSAKHVFTGLESDDWIALDEGSWFYMPSLYPAASFNQAMEVLQTQDAMIQQIPEVENVLGKIGRVDSALDPAPAGMVETYVMLKPKTEWREGMTPRKVWDEINRVATITGIPQASPLQPIEGRVVMLQSGIKASMAIRIYGDDLPGLAKASQAIAKHLHQDRHVDAATVTPDVVVGKPYLEFEVDRKEAARYGMTTSMVNQIVAAGLGGVDVTESVEGRERYPIQVRYQRDVRGDADNFESIPVVTHAGQVVPLGRLAKLSSTWGPGAINSENARLVSHVSFSPVTGVGKLEVAEAVETSIRDARLVAQQYADQQRSDGLYFPAGNFEVEVVGSFQNQVEANRRLMWIIPTVVLINLLLHYLHFRDVPLSLIVFSGIPFAAAGGMIAVAIMGVEMNTAMWIGFIALFGIAADDGLVIATYIKQLLNRRTIHSIEDLRSLVLDAGLKRIRPCLMTTITTLVALIPVLVSNGRGADVARAMALPIFGGMLVEPVSSFVVPTLYCAYREFMIRVGFERLPPRVITEEMEAA